MNIAVSFSLKRFFGMVAVFVFGLTLVACAGPSKTEKPPAEEQATEQKGSLSRTFTIVNEQGQKSGTLTLEFGGGAILHDESGKVIGEFKAVSSEAQPSEAQSKPEATETQPEPEKPKAQSESETSEPDTKAKE